MYLERRFTHLNKEDGMILWVDFVAKCEEVVLGSGEKLNRIRKNKEAGLSEEGLSNILSKYKSAYEILPELFNWEGTPEGVKVEEGDTYWVSLFKKLRKERFSLPLVA